MTTTFAAPGRGGIPTPPGFLGSRVLIGISRETSVHAETRETVRRAVLGAPYTTAATPIGGMAPSYRPHATQATRRRHDPAE